MSNQNSTTEMQYRPEEVQELLSIKSAAYYDRVKFLGIKAQKNEKGNAYLTQEQFKELEQLGLHIQTTGKMDGFVMSNSSELAVSDGAEIKSSESTIEEIPLQDDFDDVIRAAAELKGQQLIMPQLVIQELASRMTYEDLPEDVKRRVDSVRSSTSPKHPSQLADQLLARHRQIAIA